MVSDFSTRAISQQFRGFYSYLVYNVPTRSRLPKRSKRLHNLGLGRGIQAMP